MIYSFIGSNYNEETGVSTVTIGTKWGMFTGSTKLHEKDKDNVSQIFGGELAETKAIIKALKARVKEINSQLKVVNNIEHNFRQIKKINFPNYTYKVIGNISNQLNKEKTNLLNDIEVLSNSYINAIKARDERLDKNK